MDIRATDKRVITAEIENMLDLYRLHRGELSADQVRRVAVTDAAADVKTTTLAMPKRLIERLGLTPMGSRFIRAEDRPRLFNIHIYARLIVQGRDCGCEVIELPDDRPVLIGSAPLLLLDFVIDPESGRLVGNPDHGGEPMMDLF